MTGELIPLSDGEVAWDGTADYEVLPDRTSTVEVWERVVPFGTTGPLPDFAPAWSGDRPTQRTRTGLPPGSLFQVRLYDAGEGRPSGDGPVHGALDFPSLNSVNGEQESIIDRCRRTPQLDISPGGTYVSAGVSVCPASMARVQVGNRPPVVGRAGLGVFDRMAVAGSVASLAPRRVHGFDVVSRSFDRVPLLPGNDVWFVVLAWTGDGFWDYAWTTAEPGQPPEVVRLKRRRVEIRLTDLFIVDDSDAHSGGDAMFTLVVTRGPASTTTQSFSTTVHSGHQVVGIPPFMKVDTGLETIPSLAESTVSVCVAAREDDSGDGAPDSDDYSHAHVGPLSLPSGPAETVTNRTLEVTSTVDRGDPFRFRAQIAYSVSYA